ncbi:phospholipase d [Musa troglodytarum]|uniref:phospholipase D n=1 Tax=Musa troglodytarum TaxID=320322 RepID=A0A9E7ER00_9LILI|nr:phospholipase d [Musa troglodytarum]
MQSEPSIAVPSSHSFRLQEHPLIFDELPKADIVSVSRPDATDIIPMLLSYTVEFRYKSKDGSKILVLVCLCLLCKMTMKLMMSLLLKAQEENLSAKSRDIPSSAALPIIRPALGRQHSVSDRAKVAMQGIMLMLVYGQNRSHHEKIVIVDNQICFTGGLDLCFGRHDNFEHKFGDSPPLIWPGKDYYDPRSKASNEQAIPLLMPQHNMLKGFVDDLGSPQSQRDGHISVISQLLPQNMEEWRGTQERGSQVVTANEATQVGPHTPCRCQVGHHTIANFISMLHDDR